MPALRVALCFVLSCIACGTLLSADDAAARPKTRLRIQLRDGRWISGELDPQTSEEHLWIHTTEASIVARSGFRWETVNEVVQNGERLAPSAFRNLITLASAELSATFDATAISIPMYKTRTASLSELAPVVVRSVDIRATVTSWDGDVEPDGLLVEVLPRDSNGYLAPVNGQISFTLIGENTPYDPQDLFQPRARYPEIARSNELVRVTDFGDGAAVYKMPFGVEHPDFRFDLAPHAILTATLGVPGQGTFHASDDSIHFRPGNWIRDRRQQFFGTRYFPQEGTVYRR
jgi:hypothetical protein